MTLRNFFCALLWWLRFGSRDKAKKEGLGNANRKAGSRGPLSRMQCPSCGSSDIEWHEAGGDAVCVLCGTVCEESVIVSSIEFSETGNVEEQADSKRGKLLAYPQDSRWGVRSGGGERLSGCVFRSICVTWCSALTELQVDLLRWLVNS